MRRRFISYQGLQESFDYNHYLTIEALEDGLTVAFEKEIEYGIDGVGWKKLRGGLKSPSINKGHTISFRAKLTPEIWNGIGTFTISNACNLIGNIMSLLFYNDAASATSLIGFDYAFCRLFVNCATIKSVSSNFTPATTLTISCYDSMFQGCTRLVNAPELPATTLANNCYDSMFQGCTSLVNAPELPATTLASHCYYYMLYGCVSLNYIKMLATDISASYCLQSWVTGVSPTGTFVKNKDATWDVVGEDGIPEGWTVVNDGEEEGGKIINTGRIKPVFFKTAYINWDFPVASDVSVIFHTEMSAHKISTNTGTNKSGGLMLGPGESELIVDYIEPIEDDTYIYEVIVEE